MIARIKMMDKKEANKARKREKEGERQRHRICELQID
jgi:hypothetical protein